MKATLTIIVVLIIAAIAVACLVYSKRIVEEESGFSGVAGVGRERDGSNEGKEPQPDDEDHDNEKEVIE